jgi:hypothetical protein
MSSGHDCSIYNACRGNQATFDEELALAYSVIVQLEEDKEWIEGVADERADRIAALAAELEAARLQIEALRSSGKKERKHIGTIVLTFLTGVSSIGFCPDSR